MTEWRSVSDDLPNWQDGGNVELRRADGTVVVGFLDAVDEIFDGEGEYPEWELTLSDGRVVSLHDFESYRQLISK